MPAKLPEIVIKRDSREQEGWIFDEEEKRSGKIRILGTEVGCLNTGDYSIVGLENLLSIERKFGLTELYGAFVNKDAKDRFEREMFRMSEFKYKYLLVESNLSKEILGLGVTQVFKGPCVNKVVDWILSLQIKYGVVPMFVGDAGKKIARYIFEQVVREEIKNGFSGR